MAAAQRIDDDLPALARMVIRRHLDSADPATARFLNKPDDREQHQTDWHRWGIITHTRVFLQALESDVPDYLKQWNLWPAVDAVLSERIDGASKWELLRPAILLHDIGKFGARTHDGSRFHFAHHERLSGAIIRDELDLRQYGLTDAQIRYVAMTAEDHFVLGLVRKRAREQGRFNQAFVRTVQFEELARRIRTEHPDDYVEIGVLFLGDSLAKVDAERGPRRALDQHSVNVDVAHHYLDIVIGGGS